MSIAPANQPTPLPPAAPRAPIHVRAIIPCHNRPADLALLLADLAAQQALDREPPIHLSIAVIDNASDPPLQATANPNLTLLRSDSNLGGSGGFNRGLVHFLSQGAPADPSEYLWLLDSDARLEPAALRALVDALHDDPALAVVGSALLDPITRRPFELGGHIDLRTGEYVQPAPPANASAPIRCQYVAACSMLVRRSAVEAAGLMSDVFLSGDDVEWCLRIARETGLAIAAVPASRATHPHPDRMRTSARYYAARNAFAAIDSASAGLPDRARRAVRRRRARREIFRAAAQLLVGRSDLAALHFNALRDASQGLVTGPAPQGAISFTPFRPREELAAAVRDSFSSTKRRGRLLLRRSTIPDPAPLIQELHRLCIDPLVLPADDPPPLRAALARFIRGPQGSVAIVSARARPGDWLLAPTIITVAPEGFIVSRVTRFRTAISLARLFLSAAPLIRAIANRPLPDLAPLPSPDDPLAPTFAPNEVAAPVARPSSQEPTRPLSLAVIVLSFNRWPHLQRTLDRLREDPATRDAHIIVADNASLDGTPARLRAHYPAVELLALDHNRGVAAFNRAARRATEDLLLILDDDAWPEPGILQPALDLLVKRPEIAAIPLHPRHPASGDSEWPFAAALADPALAPIADRFPVMGCANLVRREAWERVGGYDEAFFLYRNDTDLAMKLLAAGYSVHFNPDWTAWHDSPFAERKSRRWFELATRNWVWLCRRHGTALTRLKMILLGSLNAHRLARFSLLDHLAAFRGLREGLRTRVPPLSHFVVVADRQGRALRDLLTLRLASRRPTSRPAKPRP